MSNSRAKGLNVRGPSRTWKHMGVRGQFRTIHGTRSAAITVRALTGPSSKRGKSGHIFTPHFINVYTDIILLLKSRISNSLYNAFVNLQYSPKTLLYRKYHYVALPLLTEHISLLPTYWYYRLQQNATKHTYIEYSVVHRVLRNQLILLLVEWRRWVTQMRAR